MTDSQRETILAALRTGSTLRAAVESAGVPWRQWCRWRRDVSAGNASPEVIAAVGAAVQAHAQAQVALTGLVMRAALRDWRAAAWLLDHRAGEPRARAELQRVRASLRALQTTAASSVPAVVTLEWPE